MSYLSDAHREWHTINGQFATCPLDCGANEPDLYDCPVCGETTYVYPSDPGTPYVGCADPAACAAEMPAPVTVPAAPVLDDPWAVDPPF